MWLTWDPSGADSAQMGPMLAVWTLVSGTPHIEFKTLYGRILDIFLHNHLKAIHQYWNGRRVADVFRRSPKNMMAFWRRHLKPSVTVCKTFDPEFNTVCWKSLKSGLDDVYKKGLVAGLGSLKAWKDVIRMSSKLTKFNQQGRLQNCFWGRFDKSSCSRHPYEF